MVRSYDTVRAYTHPSQAPLSHIIEIEKAVIPAIFHNWWLAEYPEGFISHTVSGIGHEYELFKAIRAFIYYVPDSRIIGVMHQFFLIWQ